MFLYTNEVMLPIDERDPKQVACAWSSIVQPGDPSAGWLREILGSVTGLKWIFGEFICSPIEVDEVKELDDYTSEQVAKINWKKCHDRWHSIAQTIDVQAELLRLSKIGGTIIAPGEKFWPSQLSDLGMREPLALWVAGDYRVFSGEYPMVSIVGSRASTAYGNRIASQLAFDLAESGIMVVSGGAYGIDSAAHRGALSTNNFYCTSAVLCGGIGNLYPRENESLFGKIKQRGMLITEVPTHWRPARWRFLERNRLIAALSQVTVVVEAGERSGACATANRALELGRDVAAVPGPVTSSSSRGCHSLIKDGAHLVADASDVISLLSSSVLDTFTTLRSANFQSGNAVEKLDPLSSRVVGAFPLSKRGDAASLSQTCGLSVTETETVLLKLQLKNKVTKSNGLWLLQ